MQIKLIVIYNINIPLFIIFCDLVTVEINILLSKNIFKKIMHCSCIGYIIYLNSESSTRNSGLGDNLYLTVARPLPLVYIIIMICKIVLKTRNKTITH